VGASASRKTLLKAPLNSLRLLLDAIRALSSSSLTILEIKLNTYLLDFAMVLIIGETHELCDCKLLPTLWGAYLD
jgi:hypothetical protein